MDSMRSIDIKKSGQHQQKIDITKKIDSEILSLYPSLDYKRNNVHGQSKKGMITLLKILYMATEGSVTKYGLTQWKAEPRFGGQVAQNALKELAELGLLKAEKVKSEKGTPRKDYSLTSKGLLACLCFSNIQQKSKLAEMLKQPKFKDDKLAFVMYLFNETFVRGEKTTEELSPVIVVLKKMAKKGFNFERKSENDIATDLRQTEQEMFLKSLKISMLDSSGSMILALSRHDKKTRDIFFDSLKKTIEQLSNSVLSQEEKETVVIKAENHTRNMKLFLLSQEYSLFMQKGFGNLMLEDLAKRVVDQMGYSENKEENLSKLEDFWLKMREALFEQLFDYFSNS